ncbi:MAG TPA: S8 family peptidase [Bdellovibrionales bacterium]|nr:S8 family peptidase [Bdellovibrionales bacterium]
MDVVSRVYAALFAVLLLTSCGQKRTAATIVPQASNQCKPTAIEGQYIVEWLDGRITVERAKDREDFLENFVTPKLDLIKRAELDQIVRLKSQPVQASETIPPNWGQEVVGAQAAWDRNIRGTNVVVAVIDSGIDSTHPQLRNQLAINPNESANGVDDDKNGYIDDIAGWDFATPDGNGTPNPTDQNGHGTHISGVIAADPMAGTVQGIAPQAKILPLQFMDASGAGTISRAIQAIEYAAQRGAKVINASWGTVGCNQSLETVIKKLSTQNILFVTASGNDYSDLTYNPSYPAAFPGIGQIVVGALTYNGFRADFSNYGPLVDLVAPGSPIYSTVPASRHASGYAFMSGTSMAAPFVSGAAALLWSYQPTASVERVREAILGSVLVKDHLNVATRGQLDIAAALQKFDNPE